MTSDNSIEKIVWISDQVFLITRKVFHKFHWMIYCSKHIRVWNDLTIWTTYLIENLENNPRESRELFWARWGSRILGWGGGDGGCFPVVARSLGKVYWTWSYDDCWKCKKKKKILELFPLDRQLFPLDERTFHFSVFLSLSLSFRFLVDGGGGGGEIFFFLKTTPKKKKFKKKFLSL